MGTKKQITIYDIAEHLGISTGTVNRALNNKGRISEDTRKKVLAAAQELGYKANKAAQSLRRNPIYIGAIICCPVPQFLREIRRGMESAFEELKQYNVYSDIRDLGEKNCEELREEIELALEDFREKDYQGVVLFLSGNGSVFREKIDDLSGKGLRFATVANDIKGCSRTISIGTDGFIAGSLAAEILALSCRGKRIAVLTGSRETAIHRSNIDGFLHYSSAHDCFKKVTIFEHDDNEKTAKLRIDEMQNSAEPPDGIYITSAISNNTCKCIEELYRAYQPVIVTTDLFEENRRLLSSKAACATIYQNPFEQGKEVVFRLYEHISENREDIISFPLIPQAVFESNMSLFKR